MTKTGVMAMLAAMLLSACSPLYGDSATIDLCNACAVSDADERILVERLNDQSPAMFPSFTIGARGQTPTISGHGFPAPSTTRYLLSHRGQFEVRSPSGELWFSQDDLADAQPGFDGQQRPVLNLRLRAQAAQRVATLSAAAVGASVIATFDGTVMATAKVTEPITAGALQWSSQSTLEELQLMATVLRTGALSFTPSGG